MSLPLILGFPVTRLPSPKVARTARIIDNRRLQRGDAGYERRVLDTGKSGR